MIVSIIGAGIAGLCTGIALRKFGIEAEIFEAAPTVCAAGAGIGLAPNGVKALEKLGVADLVFQHGTQLPSFNILNQKGEVLAENKSSEIQRRYGLDNFTIHRRTLHECLLEKLDGAKVKTGKKLTGMTRQSEHVILSFADGSTHTCDYVIAADGIYSVVRRILHPEDTLRYAGYTCWRAVADGKGIGLEGASETWGKKGRFGLVPLSKDQIYWFACVNAPAGDSAMKNFKIKDLIAQFSGYHQPIVNVLMQTEDQALIHNDLYDIRPLEKFAYDRILLIGDAAHATTPNMGQGACQAMEDAAVLLDEFETGKSIALAFLGFEKRRLAKNKMIIEQSRNIGAVAQLSNPVLAGLRDLAIRLTPDNIRYDRMAKIYNVDF